MSLKDEFRSEVDGEGGMETFDLNDKSSLKKVWQRADFPLFFLGVFILVLLLFIVLKMPSDNISQKSPETALNKQQVKELKKALDDIRNEIVNIRYSLSKTDSDEVSQNFLRAVNQLDMKIDSKFDELKSYVKSTKKRSSSPSVISTRSKAAVAAPVVKKVKTVKTKAVRFHTVKKGETLYRISKKYNVSVGQIKKLNNMKNNSIQPGEKLRVK